jgi:hypothetical protein
MARLSGWRAIPVALAATAAFLLLAALLFWVAVAAAVAIGLVAFQIVLLPRLARRLQLAPLLFVLLLLPLCALGGWLAVGEATGPLAGAAAWALLVAAPRVALDQAGRWLGRRAARWGAQARTTAPPHPSGQIIETVACPRCGRFRLAAPDATCPHCAAERPAIAPPA